MPPKATEQPTVFVVVEAFVADIEGVPTVFTRGEPIEPDHLAVKRWPEHFAPLEFVHKVKRAAVPVEAPAVLAKPEVRA